MHFISLLSLLDLIFLLLLLFLIPCFISHSFLSFHSCYLKTLEFQSSFHLSYFLSRFLEQAQSISGVFQRDVKTPASKNVVVNYLENLSPQTCLKLVKKCSDTNRREHASNLLLLYFRTLGHGEQANCSLSKLLQTITWLQNYFKHNFIESQPCKYA